LVFIGSWLGLLCRRVADPKINTRKKPISRSYQSA
jgi:hypothetical protein